MKNNYKRRQNHNKKFLYFYMTPEKDLEIMTNTKIDIARNEGYNNGKVEIQNKTILSMLKHKIPINDIAKITGLDSNYIQSLQHNKQKL